VKAQQLDTRSASSLSVAATSPPSPSANRFFVGKKLKVESAPTFATPSRAEGLRCVLDDRHPEVTQPVERHHPPEQVHRHHARECGR
jgi:hypothetical protein